MLVPASIPSEDKTHHHKKSSSKVKKKGCLSVTVGSSDDREKVKESSGGDEGTRFDVPIWQLSHPLFEPLLDRAHEVYGYDVSGPLRLPCSPDELLQVQSRIERDSNFLLDHQAQGHPPQLKMA
ncbi:hypothetical protein Scep_019053 [Stephania cephalantha]|uniref:Uncharacterized protein n=1 Tax=Stephania cephalantha TaxID=152367 RepID=A0AAP0NMH2_9MAGN